MINPPPPKKKKKKKKKNDWNFHLNILKYNVVCGFLKDLQAIPTISQTNIPP